MLVKPSRPMRLPGCWPAAAGISRYIMRGQLRGGRARIASEPVGNAGDIQESLWHTAGTNRMRQRCPQAADSSSLVSLHNLQRNAMLNRY